MMKYVPLVILLLAVAALVWGVVRLKDRFAILGEFIVFLRERKLWWIIPIFVVFALAGLLVLLTFHSPLAAFIYPLF